MRQNFSLLIKPASENCNINCTYCFYHRPWDPYGDTKGSRRMDSATLKNMLHQVFEIADGGNVSMAFQGGEPLLAGHEYFEELFHLCKTLGRPNQVVSLSVQTNGMYIDQRFCDIFKQGNYLLGISIDGPKDIHDYYRVNYNKEGTYDKVIAGMKLLQENNLEFNILGVVNDLTQKNAKRIFRHFVNDLGVNYMQFNPCVEVREGELIKPSVSPEGYKQFLDDLYEVFIEEGWGKVSIRIFDNITNQLYNGAASMCFSEGRCANTMIVEYNGDVYPCDFFVHNDYLMGNFNKTPLKDIIKHHNRTRLQDEKEKLNKKCQECEFLQLCRGGCPKYRELREIGFGDKHFYFCEAYESLYKKAVPKFGEFVREIKEQEMQTAMTSAQKAKNKKKSQKKKSKKR